MYSTLCIARTLNASCRRYLSSSKLPPEIVVPLSRDMIVCWHPAKKFPYEYSLPLPEEKKVSSNSVLCVGEKEIKEVFERKIPEQVVEKLAKITYTTKHRWYPKKIRRKSIIEPERPYL